MTLKDLRHLADLAHVAEFTLLVHVAVFIHVPDLAHLPHVADLALLAHLGHVVERGGEGALPLRCRASGLGARVLELHGRVHDLVEHAVDPQVERGPDARADAVAESLFYPPIFPGMEGENRHATVGVKASGQVAQKQVKLTASQFGRGDLNDSGGLSQPELNKLPDKAFYPVKQNFNTIDVDKDGNVLTAAGVSAGIDMALWLVGQLFEPATARLVQRFIQYDPSPPYAAETD